MNKKQLISSILAGTLVITSISPFISQNQAEAKKERKPISSSSNPTDIKPGDIVHGKQVKEVLNISASDFIKAIEDSYANGEISKDEYITIKSKLAQRWSINGETKLIVFGDGAFDLYLNSAWSYTLVGLSTAGVAAVLAKAAAIAGAASIIVSGLRAAGNYLWGLISFIANNELSSGLIIYFKKLNNYSKPLVIYYPSQIRKQ